MLKRIAALQMESAGAGVTYPDDLAQTERSVLLTSAGAPVAVSPVSPGVSLGLGADADDPGYCLCGYHVGLGDDPAAIYHSSSGGFVDVCPIDADVPACDRATLVAAQRFEGLTFGRNAQCVGSSCTYVTDIWRALQLRGGPEGELTSGTLVLHDVETVFTRASEPDRSHHGGWAITYGEFDAQGQMRHGYAVQRDRTIGGFVVRQWQGGSQGDLLGISRWDHGHQDIDLRNDQGVLRHDTVTVDVDGGELVLEVDGREILRQDVSDVSGSFGMRNWFDTTVSYSDMSLTVR